MPPVRPHPLAHRPVARTVVYLDSTHSLVQGLRRGDPDALAALYDELGDYIRRILVRILHHDHPELEDCVQETFTIAFFRSSQLQNPSYLKTWLTRIAINTARTCLRKQRISRWLIFRDPNALPDLADQPIDWESRDVLAAVYRIMNILPAKERIPFVLRKLEQMPLAEIAAVTGVSLATTKRRVAAAERRFERLAAQDPLLRTWRRAHSRRNP